MTIRISIKAKLMAFGVTAVTAIIGIALAGYWGLREVNIAMQNAVINSSALRNHMTADMMHDALRSDVLAALLASSSDKTGNEQEIKKDFAEHAELFRSSLAENSDLPIDPKVKTALEDTVPALNEYINTAGDIIDLAFQDHEAGIQKLPDFTTSFSKLEEAMSNLSDLIETDTQKSQTATDRSVTSANNLSLVIFVISVTSIAIMSVVVVRYIVVSLMNLRDTATAVSIQHDLSLRATVEHTDEIGDVALHFNKMLEEFQNSVHRIAEASGRLQASSKALSSITDKTSEDIKKQQLETTSVATAINEMSYTVQEVAKHASLASDATSHASHEATAGKQVVAETMGSMRSLADMVKNAAQVIEKLKNDIESIGVISDVIRGIADQTNLLALNAAIEAARAGEQGRGFAVVADEVRTLAQRTQQSTNEIQKMIDKLQIGANEAVQVMGEGRKQAQASVDHASKAGGSLETISQVIGDIASMNAQIAAAAHEQTTVTDEINANVSNISRISENNTRGAEQTNSTSITLSKLADEMQSLVKQFRL